MYRSALFCSVAPKPYWHVSPQEARLAHKTYLPSHARTRARAHTHTTRMRATLTSSLYKCMFIFFMS